MVKITFVEFDGRETEVEARPGLSLMKNAVAANVPGVLAECGGNCACGTCRIYFDPQWASLMPAPRESEIEMLEYWNEQGDGGRVPGRGVGTEGSAAGRTRAFEIAL